MSEIGNGAGSGYPITKDTNDVPEVDSPGSGRTLVRAAVAEDLAACVVAIEGELGTNPAGTAADVKTRLAVHINDDGTLKNEYRIVGADGLTTLDAAIADLGAGGGVVVVPKGTHTYTSTITLSSKSNIVIMGSGSGATIEMTGDDKNLLTLSSCNNVFFQNLHLKVSGVGASDCVDLTSCNRVTFLDVTFEGAGTYGLDAPVSNDYVLLIGCNFVSNATPYNIAAANYDVMGTKGAVNTVGSGTATEFTTIKTDNIEEKTVSGGIAVKHATNFEAALTQANVAVLDNNDIVTIREPFYLGEDMFPCKMPMIRNKEMNNLLSVASGTEITVSSINTVSNTITLSWLPYIDSIVNPTTGKEWALIRLPSNTTADPGRTGNYVDIFKITGGTYSSRVLNYEVAIGAEVSWSVGERVALYNPFEALWDWYSSNPIIGMSGSGWRKTYVNPGAVYKKADGTWVLLVNGYNGTTGVHQVGGFSSSDLKTWSVLNSDNAIITPGAYSWCNDGILITGGVLRCKNEDRLIAYASGYNAASAKWAIGWVKFDEALSTASIEYSTAEIINSVGSTAGFIQPSVIRYGNYYRMAYIDRSDTQNPDTSTIPWGVREAFSDLAEGTFTDAGEIFAGRLTNDGIYRSNHVDALAFFLYKNRLYLIMGGVSRYKDSGNKSNRLYGLAYWDERQTTPSWREDPRSPIFMNTLQGTQVWGASYGWADDHVGGYPVIITNPTDGKVYMFWSSNSGSDTYQVGVIELDVQNLF